MFSGCLSKNISVPLREPELTVLVRWWRVEDWRSYFLTGSPDLALWPSPLRDDCPAELMGFAQQHPNYSHPALEPRQNFFMPNNNMGITPGVPGVGPVTDVPQPSNDPYRNEPGAPDIKPGGEPPDDEGTPGNS